jgi:hypothetical protein
MAGPLITYTPGGIRPSRQYSYPVKVNGGVPPYTFSMLGSLPVGLSFDAINGVISGIPASALGANNLTIKVTDSVGASTTVGPFSLLIK